MLPPRTLELLRNLAAMDGPCNAAVEPRNNTDPRTRPSLVNA